MGQDPWAFMGLYRENLTPQGSPLSVDGTYPGNYLVCSYRNYKECENILSALC